MTTSKSPHEALAEIGIMESVMAILVILGFGLLSWATIGSGFAFDAVLWFLSLIIASGAWYLSERFKKQPDRSLLGTLRIVMVAYVVIWIAAAIATITYWEEVDWATILGVLMSAAVTFLIVRITILGTICVAQQVQPFAADSAAYGSPMPHAGPPVYGAPGQPVGMQSGSACPSCGRPVQAGTRFCPYDGTPVPPACPSCGHVEPAGMSFCSTCGSRLKAT